VCQEKERERERGRSKGRIIARRSRQNRVEVTAGKTCCNVPYLETIQEKEVRGSKNVGERVFNQPATPSEPVSYNSFFFVS